MTHPAMAKAPTPAQRVTHAAESVAEHLRLANVKRLSAVLAEIAAEEVMCNPSFVVRVRSRYDELAPAHRGASSYKMGPRPPKAPKRVLIPLKTVETGEVNISAALNPYWLYEVFGANQLADALEEHALASLKEAVEFVQERHPETKPTNKSKRTTIIEYIVKYVLADSGVR